MTRERLWAFIIKQNNQEKKGNAGIFRLTGQFY
jgi:hypothetical protein